MTSSLNGGPVTVPDGTPLARAVTAAKNASRTDVSATDAAYRRACELASDDALWIALATEHCARLLEMRDAALSLRRCQEYVDQAGERPDLLLMRAEIRSALASHATAESDARAVRSALGDRAWLLAADHHARLLRVEGLAAADRGELGPARKRLAEAKRAFESARSSAGKAQIDRDLRQVGIRSGAEKAVREAIQDGQLRTAADFLTLAMAYKRELRYEVAEKLLGHALDDPGVDPALHLPLLCERIVLLRMIRQHEDAENLYARLAKAAAQAPDLGAAEAMLADLAFTGSPGSPGSPRFDHELRCARHLIAETRLNDLENRNSLSPAACHWRLDEAEATLLQIRDRSRDDTDITTWHLAAGELELARHFLTDIETRRTEPVFPAEAVKHLVTTIDRAASTPLTEVKAFALRLLGHACHRQDDDRAARCWNAAHRLEEDVARRQLSDPVRITMLRNSPDEHDERVKAAVALADRRHADPVGEKRDPEAVAGVVVAMESARGATILDAIRPSNDISRALPALNDLAGARRWVREVTRALSRSQAVWMMHETPDRVHHAILTRNDVEYASVAVPETAVAAAVEELELCLSEDTLDVGITEGQFERALAAIAEKTGVGKVIPELLPPGISRIAIVAGKKLSEVPFAGVLIPGTGRRIAQRYALSDLPCLSVLGPLRKKGRRLRGDRALLVSPPDDKLTKAENLSKRKPLDLLNDAEATLDELRQRLKTQHRLVRIDSHGEHAQDNADRSILRLAPEGPEGHVTAGELAGLHLRRCATLVLGACESGMAQALGQDERTGFVRAGMSAGAASVVAARWVADDRVAAAVLDRFERYVRYLPRDVALQRAQLDVLDGGPGIPMEVPDRNHPARWACWTLYGDPGLQTGAGPVRRFLRRKRDKGGTLRNPANSRPPKVFISFAGEDRQKAKDLAAELAKRGIETFVDEYSIQNGQNIVQAINDALDESDFFVLLWSRHSADRPWVGLEWTAALGLDLTTKGAFLFVVRLDDTPLKTLLTTRKYLHAAGGWEATAGELVDTWYRDWNAGLPVRPAPAGEPVVVDETMIELGVRNLALSVQHVIKVPASATGRQLDNAVRSGLALPEEVTEFGGKLGMKFHYQLTFHGEPVPDKPLSEVPINAGSTIDLTVEMEGWGPDGSTGRTTFRRDATNPGLSPVMTQRLLNQAFSHLRPRLR